MNRYEDIVDAKLYSYTQVDESQYPFVENVQDLIAYCAKVSNPSSEHHEDLKTSEKLIKNLIEWSHWSPLEMADITLDITTTRDIGRQIIRHPSFRFQEFSQRYAEALTDTDQGIQLVMSEARLQDKKNRQSSIELPKGDGIQKWWDRRQSELALEVTNVYNAAIHLGIAKEVARKILPEGMTTTRMFMKGSIRSWIHYIETRQANGTQKEHVLLARCCAEAISKVFPMAKEII